MSIMKESEFYCRSLRPNETEEALRLMDNGFGIKPDDKRFDYIYTIKDWVFDLQFVRVQKIGNNERLIGHIGAYPQTVQFRFDKISEAGIRDVCTHRDFQRQGHGLQLLYHTLRELRKRKFAISFLWTGSHNFYNHAGWVFGFPMFLILCNPKDIKTFLENHKQENNYSIGPLMYEDEKDFDRILDQIKACYNAELLKPKYFACVRTDKFCHDFWHYQLTVAKDPSKRISHYGDFEFFGVFDKNNILIAYVIYRVNTSVKEMHILEWVTSSLDDADVFAEVLIEIHRICIAKNLEKVYIYMNETWNFTKLLKKYINFKDQSKLISGLMINIIDLSRWFEPQLESIRKLLVENGINEFELTIIETGTKLLPEDKSDCRSVQFRFYRQAEQFKLDFKELPHEQVNLLKSMELGTIEIEADQFNEPMSIFLKTDHESLTQMIGGALEPSEAIEDELIQINIINNQVKKILEIIFPKFTSSLSEIDHV